MSSPQEDTKLYRDVKAECESIARLCRGSEASLREIGHRVRGVPSLSKLAIHAANATALGMRNAITRVDHAVLVLGTQRMHSLARRIATGESAVNDVDAAEEPE